MRDRIIFSNNQQVSARQISRALFLEMLGISTLLLPPALARCAGRMVCLPFYLEVF